MGTRGRKSAAELSVVGPSGVESSRRPDPPDDLTDEQAEHWRWTVAGYAPDRFDRGAQPLLAQYCRHVVAARRAAQMIAQIEASADFNIATWDMALKAQERQSARMEGLATKLRITPQSRYTPNHAATVDGKARAGTNNPWG